MYTKNKYSSNHYYMFKCLKIKLFSYTYMYNIT